MPLKYQKEERLKIGRRIYNKEINQAQAALIYDIDQTTARNYLRLYKAAISLGEEVPAERTDNKISPKPYEAMSRTELIAELRRLTGK